MSITIGMMQKRCNSEGCRIKAVQAGVSNRKRDAKKKCVAVKDAKNIAHHRGVYYRHGLIKRCVTMIKSCCQCRSVQYGVKQTSKLCTLKDLQLKPPKEAYMRTDNKRK